MKHTRIAYRHFECNRSGEDWVCGDIHGCFSLLEKELERAGFDPGKDRLFCVGDLIDRGRESHRALEFLRHPWFHSVMGNHERMLLETLEGFPGAADSWYDNGGSWYFTRQKTPEERSDWYETLAALPLAIEVEVDERRAGIVHAALPEACDWPAFIGRLEQGNWESYGHATWGHWSYTSLARGVAGIDAVFSGHRVLPRWLRDVNIFRIDTGAFLRRRKPGSLTLLRIREALDSLGAP